jgi:hypothetical protein
MKFYTGIGSRETPKDILLQMTALAIALDNDDWVLRSGGAAGADSAFELGTDHKVIYLPWSGFTNKIADNKSYIVPPLNVDWVYDYHPAPELLSKAGFKLMSRNTYQVLGDDFNTPSEFVVCWTSDGNASGGTGQALRIAKDFNIPIYNLYDKTALTSLCDKYEISLAC